MDDAAPWNSHEPAYRYSSLFPVLPHFVAHYTVGGKLSYQIGIPSKYALNIGDEIVSLLIANQLGVSFSTAKKNYRKCEADSSRWLGLTDRIDAIFSEGQELFGRYLALEKGRVERGAFSRELSIQFFFRNLASFEAAKRLSDLGYLCEVATILRSAIEQFGICAQLLETPISADIKKMSGVRSLRYLKKHVPGAGPLYGILSKYAHFEYDHHTHFFETSVTSSTTLRWAPVLRAYSIHILFVAMVCISRYVLVQIDHSTSLKSGFAAFIDKVDQYSDEVCTMLSKDIVLARLDILLQEFLRNPGTSTR